MAIDLNGKLLTLAEAARAVPGGPVHITTLHRWRQRGVRGIQLETVLRGGVRLTSMEAIEEFFMRSTAAADGKAVGDAN